MASVLKTGAKKVEKVIDVNKGEHLDDVEKNYLENEVKTRPIEFKQVGTTIEPGGGIVVILKSMHKRGKSIGAGLYGYFHPDFKQYMPLDCQRLLASGKLPQIDQILVLDTEISWRRDMNSGDLRTMLLPLINAGRIRFVETPLKRKHEGVGKEKKVVTINDIDIERERQNFEAAVWKAIDEFGSNTLIIPDSMSDYKKSLDDEQEVMFKKGVITSYKQTKDTAADQKENEALRTQFNQYRNKWWHNTLIQLRTNNCWVVETIKLSSIDDDYREILAEDKKTVVGMKPEYYALWGKNTEYRVDQGYALVDYVDKNSVPQTGLRFDWGKHRHSVSSLDKFIKNNKKITQADIDNYQEKCMLPYKEFDRMAMMKVLADMAPSLLGELNAEQEAHIWGA